MYDIPIFATSDVPPDKEISKLFVIDWDNLEIPICDCIYYDRNGNPNCKLHKGKLQEFYEPVDVLSVVYRQVNKKETLHIDVGGIPDCNIRMVIGQEWKKSKGYVNCKNCLRTEWVRKKKEIEKEQKWNSEEKFFFEAFEALKPEKWEPTIKDVQ